MNTTIKNPKVKINPDPITYNPDMVWYSTESLKILRIETNENYTKIDFVHYADRKYLNGGWVRINRNTYIRPVKTDIKLSLIKVINIPVSPATHYYKSKKDCLFFTLFFPPLPAGIQKIDIIEESIDRHKRFRFYEVSVVKIRTEALMIKN